MQFNQSCICLPLSTTPSCQMLQAADMQPAGPRAYFYQPFTTILHRMCTCTMQSLYSLDSMGYQSHGLSLTYVVTCLGDRYASKPNVPNSLPWPLAFLPPQGACTGPPQGTVSL